ncbi:uncharacterized protein LOC143037725 [Oratosquilla oratoria]|uniref:uncharacterized protein LOC143037725 n=1 Tax=Oratosquilla oratoria TaxID=337810 RepID=UPI003F777744
MLIKEQLREKKEEAKILRIQKRDEKAKTAAARKRVRAIKRGVLEIDTLTEEDKKLLDDDRENRRQQRKKEKEKGDRSKPIAELIGTLREGHATKIDTHSVGRLGEFKCKYCDALLWKDERRSICCSSGQVRTTFPSTIKDNAIKALYDGTSKLSEHFLNNMVGFNMLFSFTSFNTSNKLENMAEAASCYKIQGRIYHKIGPLKPELLEEGGFFNETGPKRKAGKAFWKSYNDSFLDLYFYHDRDQQIKLRTEKMCTDYSKKSNKNVKVKTRRRREREEKELNKNEEIITLLYEYMTANNACLTGMLKELKTAKELIRVHVEKYGKLPEMSITLKAVEGIKTREHKGVYHIPSSSQVGAIVNFDSYPLLIPNGDIGYSFTMKCANSTLNTLTPCMFYASLYMERECVYNYMTKCRRLFQQFVVDNYVKVETARLSFIEFNQNKIRKERADILRCDDGKSTGQRVIIPSSFVGGPRYMKQRQQDALAFVTNYGSPDFFITFTMNPRWEELNEAIEQTDSSSASRHRSDNDRPDLVSRIFKLKVDSIMDDLTNKNIFGRVKAFLYSIEWQKRGLPHVHILLWMEERVNAELVGSVISAEIPDKEKEPRLHDIVTKCMIHGPCKGFDESHVCCQRKSVNGNDKCQKGFPKPCGSDLLFRRNGYPLYRRRAVGEGGHSFDVKVNYR